MSIAALVIALPLATGQPAAQAMWGNPGPEAASSPATDSVTVSTASEAVKDSSPGTLETAPHDTIVVTAEPGAPPGDPLHGINSLSYSAVQSVDKAITGPVARAYKRTLPGPARSGLRNVLRNLGEPVVFLNYLLQLKPGKSIETLGRFTINSTIGVAGLFDVAKRKPFHLPYRTNGFGYTLGYYGVKPGPYMYLPLIGPTTLRDLGGRLVDLSVVPVAVGKPFTNPAFAIPTTAIRLIDERAEAEDTTRKLIDDAADPYAAVRDDYLRTRQAEIDALKGIDRDENPPSTKL
ncbi:MAG: VacJ family lipoprotein [Sphingopyxis sp.]|nr:VacJ family lipoprotein [Sphingopyxis sp.]